MPKTCFQKKMFETKNRGENGSKKNNKDQKDSVGDGIDLCPLKIK